MLLHRAVKALVGGDHLELGGEYLADERIALADLLGGLGRDLRERLLHRFESLDGFRILRRPKDLLLLGLPP